MWRRTRVFVGMPEGFRLYDPRHSGHTLSTRTGATLKEGDNWSRRTAKRPGLLTWAFFMERVTRIELALSAWEATALAEPDSL
ncbi:hypothetical protein [Streptomyces sp. NPDC050121]|uniref:hypothetical protein n=1 Tax=Streptomyces sp. NPDC050121 TaxID=3365601 RepID=UPI0037946502